MRIFAFVFLCLFSTMAQAASVQITATGSYVGKLTTYFDIDTGAEGGFGMAEFDDPRIVAIYGDFFTQTSGSLVAFDDSPDPTEPWIRIRDCTGFFETLCGYKAWTYLQEIATWDYTLDGCYFADCILDFSLSGYSFTGENEGYAVAFDRATVVFGQEEPSVIPLPASGWFLLAGVVGLAGWGRLRA